MIMMDFPWTIDTITVNDAGIINSVEPERYKSVIGGEPE